MVKELQQVEVKNDIRKENDAALVPSTSATLRKVQAFATKVLNKKKRKGKYHMCSKPGFWARDCKSRETRLQKSIRIKGRRRKRRKGI